MRYRSKTKYLDVWEVPNSREFPRADKPELVVEAFMAPMGGYRLTRAADGDLVILGPSDERWPCCDGDYLVRHSSGRLDCWDEAFLEEHWEFDF